MIPASCVSLHARDRIHSLLRQIEMEHGVRILVAAESGSRAWGFPSADSDYDIRILYLRPVSDYLSIRPVRDVIELPKTFDTMLAAELDVNGWDVRKALGLALQSNTALLEWLRSPVQYIRQGVEADELLRFVAQAGNPDWFAYRYDRPARHALNEILATPGPVKLKRYFYALRPALAYCWLREKRQLPPMDLHSLVAGLAIPDLVVEEIRSLVELKLAHGESFSLARNATIDEYLGRLLSHTAIKVPEMDPPQTVIAAADRMLRDFLFPTGARPPEGF